MRVLNGPEEPFQVRRRGAWVDLKDAVTGVAGGKLVWTFDPNEATWRAVTIGAVIETGRFLGMAATDENGKPVHPEKRAKLQELNIPYVEVGRTDLSGSIGTEGVDKVSVQMKDVQFFAHSTNALPKVWATGNVGGTFSDMSKVQGRTITVGGAGFDSNVNFTLTDWSGSVGGKWGARINSQAGTVGTVGVENLHVEIHGGAAGTIKSSGSFTGTGAGVSRSPQP